MFRRISVPLRSVARRTYATQNVKVPVQLYGLDGTYATALFEASAKASSIANTEKSLKELSELITRDPKTGGILTDPSLTKSDQESVINVVTEQLKADTVFKGFLEVLASNNRMGLLPEVIRQFQVLADAHNGRVEAVVTSAIKLDNSAMKRITAALEKSEFVGPNQTLKVTNVVNPAIKGGLIVDIGDRTADLSVARELTKFNELLSTAI